MATDFLYNSVQLLLHGEGADLSTTFTDNSANVFVPTAVGTPKISTTVYKYGAASIKFNGTTDALSYAHSANLNLATGDFTIEAFIYIDSLATERTIVQKDQSFGTTYQSYALQVTTAGALACRVGTGNAATYAQTVASANGLIVINTQYHVAFVRSGTTLMLFIDGALVQSATQTGTAVDGGKAMLIGRSPGGGGTADAWMSGYLDEVRITKGAARYTAAFTPPTEAFPDSVTPGEIDLDATLPALTFAAFTGPQMDLSIPALTFAAYTGPQADLTLPAITLSANTGGLADLNLPMLTLRASGHDSSGENALDAILPALTLEAWGGVQADLDLPALEFAGELSITNFGEADVTLPALTLTASGTTSAALSADLTLPMLSLVGYGGSVISVTMGAITIEAEGTTGGLGSMTATLPMFELVAEVSAGGIVSADLMIPALQSGPYLQMWATLPGLQLVAVGTATVTATYEAYSLNLKHAPGHEGPDELTRYSNFPFDQVIRYRGSYFGVAAGGLYLLEGTTDYAPATPLVPAPIAWDWRTCMTDFGMPNKHTVVSAYFGGRLGPDATITLWAGDSADQAYSFETPRGASAQTYRQKFGRGVKSRYSSLGAAGDGELALDTIEFNIANLARRI